MADSLHFERECLRLFQCASGRNLVFHDQDIPGTVSDQNISLVLLPRPLYSPTGTAVSGANAKSVKRIFREAVAWEWIWVFPDLVIPFFQQCPVGCGQSDFSVDACVCFGRLLARH